MCELAIERLGFGCGVQKRNCAITMTMRAKDEYITTCNLIMFGFLYREDGIRYLCFPYPKLLVMLVC